MLPYVLSLQMTTSPCKGRGLVKGMEQYWMDAWIFLVQLSPSACVLNRKARGARALRWACTLATTGHLFKTLAELPHDACRSLAVYKTVTEASRYRRYIED